MLALGTWILLCLSSLLFVIYMAVSNLTRKTRKGEPPIVKGSLIWGSSKDFALHAVDFLHKSRKTYGEVFTIRLINQYLTVIMDPHAYEAMSKERNFDFDPIQKQVNLNVFSFVVKEPKKMIKDTGRTVRGSNLPAVVGEFSTYLDTACSRVHPEPNNKGAWATEGLRMFCAKTMFDAIFNSVFGRADGHAFNSQMAYKNFDIFHKYFNYFWLGLPKGMFPPAMKALGELLLMPGSDELLARDDLSGYVRTAIGFMKEQGQTESDIKGHNLVYLHVNYNTFRLAFWVISNLLEDEKAMAAVREELNQAIYNRLDAETNTATFTIKDIEELEYLDSLLLETMRMASGVFMVRYIQEDTKFTIHDGSEHLMRKGDRVAIYPPAIHKDPEIFEDPLVFKHNRFVNNQKFYKHGKEIKHPVIAFGSLCPGKRFAQAQLKWYVMEILTRFEMRLQEGEHAEYAYQYHGHEVLPPIRDVNMDFRHQENAPRIQLAGPEC